MPLGDIDKIRSYLVANPLHMEIETQEYELNRAESGFYGSLVDSFFSYSPITSAHGTIRTFRTVTTEFFYQYVRAL